VYLNQTMGLTRVYFVLQGRTLQRLGLLRALHAQVASFRLPVDYKIAQPVSAVLCSRFHSKAAVVLPTAIVTWGIHRPMRLRCARRAGQASTNPPTAHLPAAIALQGLTPIIQMSVYAHCAMKVSIPQHMVLKITDLAWIVLRILHHILEVVKFSTAAVVLDIACRVILTAAFLVNQASIAS